MKGKEKKVINVPREIREYACNIPKQEQETVKKKHSVNLKEFLKI